MSSFFHSQQFKDGLKKVGPNSRFWYRSKLDPLTDEEYELLCKLDEEKWNAEHSSKS